MTNPQQEQPGGAGRETVPETRRDVELLIDDIVDDSFPASDPPAWGVAASRLERARRDARSPE